MKDLIYNQRQIPKEKWRYGLRSSADTGCGWIATYNALRLMDYKSDPKALIRYYEHQLPLVHGNAGTTILAPALFFKHHGFPVEWVSDRAKFDALAKNCPACILFYRWRKKYKFGAHFTTVRYENGRFIGYNTYTTSVGPDDYGESLDGFLRQKKYFAPVLIGIRDKR